MVRGDIREGAVEPTRELALPKDLLAGTLAITLGYRGEGFAGYAEQPGQRTVAGELRQALQTLLRRDVDMECAGRTDAGVSALSFSARFDATQRTYRYRICCGPARPVLAWDHAWWLRSVPELDVDAMDAAAQALVGEHDFRSFCKATSAHLLEADGRSTCRCLSSVRVSRVCEAGEELVAVDVTGNAFLHNMVRIIVGSLVEVGRGHRDAAWLEGALAARDRSAAGPTAPARGLVFERVDYPEGALEAWR